MTFIECVSPLTLVHPWTSIWSAGIVKYESKQTLFSKRKCDQNNIYLLQVNVEQV